MDLTLYNPVFEIVEIESESSFPCECGEFVRYRTVSRVQQGEIRKLLRQRNLIENLANFCLCFSSSVKENLHN